MRNYRCSNPEPESSEDFAARIDGVVYVLHHVRGVIVPVNGVLARQTHLASKLSVADMNNNGFEKQV